MKNVKRFISIIIFSTLPLALSFVAYATITFVTEYQIMKTEHAVMFESLSGYGGVSGSATIKQIEERIDEIHGLQNYYWKYSDIQKPFFTDKVRVRFEKGWRWFNSQQCRNLKIIDVSGDGEDDYHNGTDYVVDYDLRLKAGISGKVRSGYDKNAGYYINIVKDEFWDDKKLIQNALEPTGKGKNVQVIIKYYHLSFMAVEDGQKIETGKYIGNIGDSGRACGLHLHMEIWIDGRNVNPFSNSTYNKKVEK